MTYFQLCGHTVFPELEGCEGKLARARFHMEVLNEEIASAARLDKHAITVEDDPNTSEYVFKVVGLQPSNPDWGYIAGDCIHNLRTVLDHLVYQLAVLAVGNGLTDDEARSCMFPMHDNPDSFKSAAKRRIKLLRPGEQTRIAELQPFNAADPSLWPPMPGYVPGIPHGVPLALGALETLDVIDKHRLVHATWRAAQWFRAEEPPIPLVGSTMFAGSLKDGDEVGRWHYALPRPELPPDIDLHRYFPIGVALGEPTHMQSAIEQLTMLTMAVEVVLAIFRPCIVEGLPALPVSAIE